MRVCEMCRQDPKAAAGGRSSGVGETGPDRHPALPFFSTNTAPEWDLNKSRQNVLSSQTG